MSSAILESISSKVLQFLFTAKVVGDIPTPTSYLRLKSWEKEKANTASKIRLLTEPSWAGFSYPFCTVYQVCSASPLALAPSRSLISALLLPVCTVYISFDQRAGHISMYLHIPLRSWLKLPACQRHHSCEASPRYGRRRSGLVRIAAANERGLALPRMRGRTKSLAMHVLSGPSTAGTRAHEWSCWFNAEASPSPHKGSLNTPSL